MAKYNFRFLHIDGAFVLVTIRLHLWMVKAAEDFALDSGEGFYTVEKEKNKKARAVGSGSGNQKAGKGYRKFKEWRKLEDGSAKPIF